MLRAEARGPAIRSRLTSTARCGLQQDDRAALWSTSLRTSALFSGTSAFRTFWATSLAAITRVRCALRWSGSLPATRRFHASSRKCPHLTCPLDRRSSCGGRSTSSWLRHACTGGRGRATVGVDYLERETRNRDVGLKGERLVVEHERAWLSAHGRPDLAELVVHVPSTLDDGAGYDVSSFLLDGSPHHIVVKATRGSITAPFFLSASEFTRLCARTPGRAIRN